MSEREKGRIKIPVIISDITGGDKISDRDIGDEINIDDITDTYNRFPGAGGAIDRATFAAFIKGFTEDLDMSRKLEIIKAEIWKKEFGYSVILKQGTSIQALHPKTYQAGFVITEVDNLGNATEIEMMWKPDEKAEPIPTRYKLYEGNDGFFLFRAFRGLLGLRGLSSLLTLVDPLRAQNGLFLEYMKHGEWQAINHPVAKIKDLNDTTYNRVKSDLSASQTDKMVIIDAEDDFYYDGPMAAGSSWDPTTMLEYGDKIISRETGLLLSMLTGDPMGYLSASSVTAAQWFDAVKQYQEIILPDYLPLLQALGLSEDVKFNDPYEPTLAEKFEVIVNARAALEGLVAPEQLVDIINEILGRSEEDRLELDPHYEEMKKMEMENAKATQNTQAGQEGSGGMEQAKSKNTDN